MITSKEAIDLIDQQKQIPHPINPICVHIIENIIYYDDEEGHRWALIYKDPLTFLLFKSVPNERKTFYLVE